MDKKEFRKIAKSKLKIKSRTRAKCYCYPMFRHISDLISFFKVKNILIFMPLEYEPNILKLQYLTRKRLLFYLPFMLNISLKVVKFKRPFVKAKFGVNQTTKQNKAFKNVDMAIVPVVGVDANFSRIGHGKGYYDMFFSELGNANVIVVFVSISDNFINRKITCSHDLVGKFYITPEKKYFLRGSDDRNISRKCVRHLRGWHRISSIKKN